METGDPIVQRLRSLTQGSPDLENAARIYEVILPILREANLHVTPVALTRDEAVGKLEKGMPLLHDVDLELDVPAARALMLHLAGALETMAQEDGPPQRGAAALYETAWEGHSVLSRATAAHQIRLALEDTRLDLGLLLPHVAASDKEFIAGLAQDLELDPELVWTLAQNVLRPVLRAWRRQLAPLVEEISWLKGYCFLCGTAATLGELQEDNQVKHLRCGHCGGDWPFPRLQCTQCGNEDHTTLGFLYPEHQRETMRIEICHKCKGYLKVIAAFSPTPVELLAVEDLATLYLDFIAQERGYGRVAFRNRF